ncbi:MULTISPECIES: ATP-binding cassette domain-containing protein [Mammaliicoccus]|jgi:molybdate transport system ATP-binding protein|uniref:ATP-binding cassette domain-containing protein n=1 Tax=Mammaliicoccus sciuri TaxID=1296 RepID=A0AAW5LRY1_MAMSC|nr:MULTISPECIES: ATP-binding cassette domain-containing protein [Mammaliicoccus]MBF0718746.1 ATP-binding cassette domain-containing protein [Mammaliicoccus sciuri]MBG9206194.1 ATP-binding cassette domain-containing protein [Mammaliicoccus sciuri]MBO1207754.1 ATP-binding cassette domain-containing protein [Mammaliicoccus sciuri]MBU6089007.1 ATP-binding cassette domain-containing protein [Mammaliicoccus sciuri]MBW3109021.1 ATP-binding cassette domain-containing protein [Mammaliicoccus sciuri]
MIDISIKKLIKDRTISLNIQADTPKIYAIVGRSGIGKSTLLNIIAGLTEAETCRIEINQKVLSDQKHVIKVQDRNIGYLFQDYQLFPHKTVHENIHYMIEPNKETEQLIKHLRIENCLNQYPSTLSGGESQRVALCRVLSVKPNLLLLDEPFSSLDDETKDEGMALVKSIFKTWQIPIILVSHSKKEVQILADEVIEIN